MVASSWRKVDAVCQIRHWWQISAESRVSAMTLVALLLLILSLAVLAGVVTAVVRAVRDDGYGQRPPPASHLPWAT